ncbi:TetR-like C-terminal domain-containing protein [Planococcus antarcticus]|uniref:TetR-like C-terminal domain-containing protein n=1 Tax=Planococcus antarcticus TaxID=161360 RepID=UPI001470AD39
MACPNRLKHFFNDFFSEKVIKNEHFYNNTTVTQDYVSSFSAIAFLGLIVQWLDNEVAEISCDELPRYIFRSSSSSRICDRGRALKTANASNFTSG